MHEVNTTADRVTKELMPALMVVGALMSLGASFGLPPALLLLLSFAALVWMVAQLHTFEVALGDVRFMAVPATVFSIGAYTRFHLVPAFYDQAYHLQIANRILDRWTWEPTHQGLDFSFRPEIVSGVAAVELQFTGQTSVVVWTPLMLMLASAYAIQRLAEHYTNRKIGVLAGVVFSSLPVVVMIGRTMLLDVAVAGMLVSVVHRLVDLLDEQDGWKAVQLGVLSGVVGLTKYLYLYLGGWVFLTLLVVNKRRDAGGVVLGYAPVVGFFMLKNLIAGGSVLAPLQTQIVGTMASVTAIAEGSTRYTTDRFMAELVEQWAPWMLAMALYGTALLVKRDRRFLLCTWWLVAPALFIHGYVLNFGWVRYSTPWLALLCLGVPAAIHGLKQEWPRLDDSSHRVSITIGMVVLACASPMVGMLQTVQAEYDTLHDTRAAWAKIYTQSGDHLGTNDVVVTGLDITFGLHAATPAYRYENPERPFLHAIEKFQATHMFSQDTNYRYDIDVNPTWLLGSPLEPLTSVTVAGRTGRLWEVNLTRWAEAESWRTHTGYANATAGGDFRWFAPEVPVLNPEGAVPHRMVRTGNTLDLPEVFDALVNRTEAVACDSVESCGNVVPVAQSSEAWAVWYTWDTETIPL